VRLIYSSSLLQLLGQPACAWMWRGREPDIVRAQIETEQRGTRYGCVTWSDIGPTWNSVGVRRRRRDASPRRPLSQPVSTYSSIHIFRVCLVPKIFWFWVL
jgi:hypothetical protein